MTTTVPLDVLCPKCHFPLSSERDVIAWCELCEWNLDVFEEPYAMRWPWRSLARAEYRLGYRLGADTQRESGRVSAGECVLYAVSLALLSLTVAVAIGGIVLMSTDFFNMGTAVLGAAVIMVAICIRPRLGLVKPDLDGTHPVDPHTHPALFDLLSRIAQAARAPMPDEVFLSERWQASSGVAGLRRQRSLVIGLPLWIALHRQEQVALLAHELAQFTGRYSPRVILARPALRTFGVLANLVKAPTKELMVFGVIYWILLLFVWRILGGLLFALLWTIHIGLNILGLRQRWSQQRGADQTAVECAGRAATLSLMNMLVMVRHLEPFVDGRPAADAALAMWRQGLEFGRSQAAPDAGRMRQLTKRTHASLFSTDLALGHRYDHILGMPNVSAAVVLSETEAERIDLELAPYVETFRRRLAADQGW